MKKLYRKGTVHPSPAAPIISDHQLSFLPATILTLTVALSPEEREVLAYLISSSANPRKGSTVVNGEHPPLFHCTCFHCYMSYWVRWDSSPNHQLIHQIIDAFEDSLPQTTNNNATKDKRGGSNTKSRHLIKPSHSDHEPPPVGNICNTSGGDEVGQGADEIEDDDHKGSVSRFVSFIGERIWGPWGH